ncbi:hypothetical protein MUK42_34355 [Musa troglodytarum]|uniref:Uncharacterized protein n=1 Tax=Musa troglodytarum TaxID=320322 RepID=A0A9E7HV22_9LILI|nr:hypothetical protein MUK42_12297 [Musa troglodytarum]URE36714.1 hypothetical protein MUK42_34355 [Musa troglodytarum]
MDPRKKCRSDSKAGKQPASGSTSSEGATVSPVDDAMASDVSAAAAEGRRKKKQDIQATVKRATGCLRRTLLTVHSAIRRFSDFVEAAEDEVVAALIVDSLGNLETIFFGYGNAMKAVARKVRQEHRRQGGGEAGASASGGRDAGGATRT